MQTVLAKAYMYIPLLTINSAYEDYMYFAHNKSVYKSCLCKKKFQIFPKISTG